MSFGLNNLKPKVAEPNHKKFRAVRSEIIQRFNPPSYRRLHSRHQQRRSCDPRLQLSRIRGPPPPSFYFLLVLFRINLSECSLRYFEGAPFNPLCPFNSHDATPRNHSHLIRWSQCLRCRQQ